VDGTSLDIDGLLRSFQIYWRENIEANEMTENEIGDASPFGN
jgi:hypothetical protein